MLSEVVKQVFGGQCIHCMRQVNNCQAATWRPLHEQSMLVIPAKWSSLRYM